MSHFKTDFFFFASYKIPQEVHIEAFNKLCVIFQRKTDSLKLLQLCGPVLLAPL